MQRTAPPVLGLLVWLLVSLAMPAPASAVLIDTGWMSSSGGRRGTRFRGGFDVGGGLGVSPSGRVGGGGGAGARLGLQIDEQWSVYAVGRVASVGPDGLGLGALMLGLGLHPIGDVEVQIALGYAGVFGVPCDTLGECGGKNGVGVELRGSYTLIGLDEPDNRIGIIVVHAIYTIGAVPDAGVAHLLQLALGAELY